MLPLLPIYRKGQPLGIIQPAALKTENLAT